MQNEYLMGMEALIWFRCAENFKKKKKSEFCILKHLSDIFRFNRMMLCTDSIDVMAWNDKFIDCTQTLYGRTVH